jgi:ABC-type multidrug transport system permease subunit
MDKSYIDLIPTHAISTDSYNLCEENFSQPVCFNLFNTSLLSFLYGMLSTHASFCGHIVLFMHLKNSFLLLNNHNLIKRHHQREVFYKHSDALFYPAPAFALAQTLVMMPLQLVESVVFSLIMYWPAALSKEFDGSRFLTYTLIIFVFSLCTTQLVRLVRRCM